MYLARIHYGAYYYALIQTYSSNAYASFYAIGYSISTPIYRRKSNGKWTTSSDETVTIPAGTDIHKYFINVSSQTTLYRQNNTVATNAPVTNSTYIDYVVLGSMLIASVFSTRKIYVCSKWNSTYSAWTAIN